MPDGADVPADTDAIVLRNGQAIAILGLFASLAIGVLLLLVFREFIPTILEFGAERATDPQVQEANDWMGQLVNNLELVFVLISVFGLISFAVFRSRVTG